MNLNFDESAFTANEGGRKRKKTTGEGEHNIDIDKEIYKEKSLFRNKNDDGNTNFDR
jgi:hypothetical protein